MESAPDAKSIRVALTTVGSRTAADTLAAALVEKKLAACVSIVGPIQSVYRWQGAIHRDEEFLLIMKTNVTTLPDLEQAIRSTHSYETPEFIVLDVTEASESYTRWLLTSLAR